MRSIPSSMHTKLSSRVQAGERELGTSLWVGRPTTPLTDIRFLESQTILSSKSITKTSIAACHPRLMRGATEVYVAYIESGVAKVTKSLYVEDMPRHIWVDTGFSAEATDVALCFDGSMPKAPNGWVEFKTEQDPWVFWILNGVLYGNKLIAKETPIILAESGCSAVSAVRAMWSSTGGFDFGLIVFFVLEGVIHYRQLIGNEWMDAEVVSFGPEEVVWEDISAFRTWDYRIGIQGKSTTGAYYELFTQFMGIGKQTSEHVELKLSSAGKLTEVDYHTVQNGGEHVELAGTGTAKFVYGLSSVPLAVYNVDDGTGDFGNQIRIQMDHPVSNVENHSSSFTLTDSNNVKYLCTATSVSEDGLILCLTFVDFNLAENTTLTLTYTPGEIQSPATALSGFTVFFEPAGLAAPDIPVPEPVAAWNTNEDGSEIALQFSQALVGDVTGEETPVGYTRKSFDLSGATITTLNQYSSSYSGERVIDGNVNTYWRGTTISNWIQFALLEEKVVTGLRIYLGNYYVSKFTFQGSNDGETWTQIGGTYSAASSTTAKWYEFTLDNAESYLYYRIKTTAGYSSSNVYVYEVELQETIPAGNELKVSVSGTSYNYVPEGQLESVSRTVTDVYLDTEDDTVLHIKLNPGVTNSIQNFIGEVKISYAEGTLRGLGGPVEDFEFVFTPSGLLMKNNPNSQEHIKIGSITASANLVEVSYKNTKQLEHLRLSVSAEAALIAVDDI